MPEQFDAYYKWLGIPPKDQPPNHYRLLGIEVFEENPDVIEASAERQASYLHEVSAGPNVKESQKLLNEIAAARLCLLDAEKKATYDTELRSKVTVSVAVDALPGEDSPLDDLPWDNLESLMTNGSSSDTTPKTEATSETLKLPAAGSSGILQAPHSSGVFSVPQSLRAEKPEPEAEEEAKSSKPRILWLAVGGGAIVIVVAIVTAILLSSGGPDNELLTEEQPSGTKDTRPQETEKKDGKPDKNDDKIQQPVNLNANNGQNGEKKDDTKKDDTKKDDTKKDDTKQDDGKVTPPKEVDNGNKEPVTPVVKANDNDDPDGNKPENGTGTKNGGGEKPVVVKKPSRTKEFHALEPLELLSREGATTFTVLEDKSVLAEHGSVKDVYEFQLKTDLPALTAIRIEALPSDSITANGPGHGKAGGFAIVEVQVAAVPADKADKPDKIKPVELSGAKSDEVPKLVEKVIDGEDRLFWPVRNGGKQTTLTLFMKNEVWYTAGAVLYVRIVQHEKLGRFRVSVSNDPELVGRKTRIEATLPLYVNLGGGEKKDQAGRHWEASQEFDGGVYGHVGGKSAGSDRYVPLTSCVTGIEKFLVTLPEGKYDVALWFSGHCIRDAAERSFEIVASGVETKKFTGLHRKQRFARYELKGVEAKDGGLTVQFVPEKGEPFLNGFEIREAK